MQQWFKSLFVIAILLFGLQSNAQTLNTNQILFARSAINSSGNQIFEQNSSLFVTPASLLKSVTTATALEVLGPDYTYKTRVGYNGIIRNGVLYGDIVVIPGSDPTLGSEHFDGTDSDVVFEKIKQAISDNHIQSVTGDIQVQQLQDDVPYPGSRLWEDMGNYYGGIPHVLNYKDNTIRITLKSGEVGSLCKIVGLHPDNVAYQFNSKVLASSSKKDSAYVYGIKDIFSWWVEGSIPANRNDFTIKAAMPDPSVYFVDDLRDYLSVAGISVGQKLEPYGDMEEGFNLLCTIESPKLSEIIEVTNHESNNLFADQLFLTLGEYYFETASWDNGVKALEKFWSSKIDFNNNFSIKDGSGLSPKNKVTPSGMLAVLSWMKNHSQYFDVYVESLAVGGMSGTLKYTFQNPALKGKIFGKSGSMGGVIGYCGYFQSEKGWSSFCIIANNYVVPTKQVRSYIDSYLTQKLTK